MRYGEKWTRAEMMEDRIAEMMGIAHEEHTEIEDGCPLCDEEREHLMHLQYVSRCGLCERWKRIEENTRELKESIKDFREEIRKIANG